MKVVLVESGVEVTRKSDISGKEHTRLIEISEKDWQDGIKRYIDEGRLIQDAFPTLSPADREFILTGITPEEWDDIFSDEE